MLCRINQVSHPLLHTRVITMRRYITSALVLSILTSPAAMHLVAAGVPQLEESESAQVKLRNVELAEGGVLQGQYINEAGMAVEKAEIVVTTEKKEHRVLSGADGKFSIEGLNGGRAVIRAGREVFACQLWSPGTAPPKSIKSIAMVASDEEVLRGNYGLGRTYSGHMTGHAGFTRFIPGRLAALSGKQILGLGLIAGGAIAISEAANNDDDAS